MTKKHVILLVEDDIKLGQTLNDFFVYNNLTVLWAKDGNSAIDLYNETLPELVLLDVVVPHKNGLEIAAEIRKTNTKVPIIFMTGTALTEKNHIDGYNLHAVNYLEKPIVPQIVLAQIRSLLQPASIKKYSLPNLTIEIDNQLLTINKKEFNLGKREIEVFTLLLEKVNTVVKRNEIMCAVWNDNAPQVDNMLDSTISNIKKVLTPFSSIKVKTIYATGYRLEVKEYGVTVAISEKY